MARNLYPEPRAPSYDEPTSVEECLPEARRMVETTHGRAALGPVEDGERVLIVSMPELNEYVRAAVAQAIEEAGAAAVDFAFIDELVEEPLGRYSAADGHTESEYLVEGRASTAITNADLVSGVAREAVTEYVEAHPEYDSVHFDIGSRGQARRDLGDRFKGNWLFDNWEEFVPGIWSFPSELLVDIEKRTVELIDRAEAVRITDPEGTHLEFEVTPEQAARWKRGAFFSGHLYLDTFGATVFDEHDVVFPDVSGVIAGAANHVGFYPRIELTFEDGRLVGVEGGGEFGDHIAELNEEYGDVQLPGYPDTGIFWFVESALGTLPKAFRRTSDLFDSAWQYPNIPERNRAGVIHHGFGTADRTHPPGVEEFCREHDIPAGHLHVHNYFSTFEIRRRDTGDWHKLVDKGRMTAMDRPEVRAHAAEYGDPDDLLSYDWIPPLPGINAEGEYQRDYAPDPAGYLRERLEAGRPI